MGVFTHNTIFTFISRVLQLCISLIISIIVARILGPEGKGIYSLVILLPTLLITFTQFGIGPASVFYTGKKIYSPKKIFGANIIFSILISTLAITIGFVIVFFFHNRFFPNVPKEYLFLALLLIPLQLFLTFLVDILLGLQEIRKYNLFQIIRSSIFLLTIIIFLLGLKLGIMAIIVGEIFSYFTGCVILFLYTKKRLGGINFFLSKKLFSDFFSYGIKSYFGNISTLLHLRVDMWMINFFLNPLMVGYYSIAAGLSERIWLISQSAGIVLFPKVASEDDQIKIKEFTPIVCRNILFITLFIALFLLLIGRWIILLFYSKSFLESVFPFQILLIGSVAIAGTRILTNDLAGRGKPMVNTYVAILSLVLNVILNIIWIPKFGIVGCAWASTISYSFMFILKTFIYSKLSGNKIKDIIIPKKSDLKYYKSIINIILRKIKIK